MVETMDLQARDELYRQIARAKENETKLALELEALKNEFNAFKQRVIVETDETPTYGSGNLVTSGVVYDALMSLSKRINLMR